MIMRDKKLKKKDLKIEKVKLEVEIDQRELEHTISLKGELLIIE